MSKAKWTIREATKHDAPMIQDLMVKCFGYSRPATFNKWLYGSAPFGRALSFVAMDGERCVGHEGLLPTMLRLGTEVVLGAQSMDTMTDPDYRGQGIFVAVAKACFELAAQRGIEVMYGFPNASSRPGLMRLNWDHTGDLPQFTRPVRVSQMLPPVVGRVADWAVALLPKGSTRSIEVRSMRPAEEELEQFLGRWRARVRLCRVERTVAWLDWRHHSDTGLMFEWFGAYRHGALVGFGIQGFRGPLWARLVDNVTTVFELLGDDSEAMGAILSAMIRRATARSCRLMKAATNDPIFARHLRRTGFLVRGRRPLCVRELTSRILGESIHAHTSWSLNTGDQDAY